jgi:hypothetical protein
MAYEKMAFSSSKSETCNNLQVDSKISSHGVWFNKSGTLENHTDSPDLAATDWPLQVPRHHLGDHKYKQNREVDPVVAH